MKIELSYREFLWLYDFIGESTTTEMSMAVWDRLDKEFRMLQEQVNEQGDDSNGS